MSENQNLNFAPIFVQCANVKRYYTAAGGIQKSIQFCVERCAGGYARLKIEGGIGNVAEATFLADFLDIFPHMSRGQRLWEKRTAVSVPLHDTLSHHGEKPR